MISVQGILKDPLGIELSNTTIRFTAVTSEGDLFKGVDAEIVTSDKGEYDFQLHKGRYRLEVLHAREFHESGIVLIDENTPSPITLLELWAYSKPLTPPLLNPDKPKWDDLYQDVIDGDEWEREAEEQVRNESILVNEDKSIHKDGDAYLAKESITTATGDVTQVTQTIAYKDEYAQESSVVATENTTRNASAIEHLGAYSNSDGSTEVEKRIKLSGSTGTTTKLITEDVDVSTKVKGEASSITTESAGSAATELKYGDNVLKSTSEVKFIDADKFVEALLEQNIKLVYSNNGFPVEAFNRLLATPLGSESIIQADKHIIQAADGFPVATFDTADRKIIFDSELVVQNTDDFIGEEGWSYDHDYEYSNDKINWSPEYTFGDIWRKEHKFKFKESDPEGTKQYIGAYIIIQLNAKDGLPGDNYYLEYEYTTAHEYPSGWRPNFIAGDDWRRWRSVRITHSGTEITKWQEEPLKGTDGPEGWIPEYQIFYGPDATKPLYTDQDNDGSLDDINLSHWHQNMSEGDLYKYERKVWWKSQSDFTESRTDTTMIPHVMEPWNGPNKIMPIAGEDYGDRFASLFLYKRAASKPSDDLGVWRYNFDSATLEPVNGDAKGWSTSVVDGLEHLWVATATAHSMSNVDSNIDNWDVDKLTSNGLKTATAYLYRVTDGNTSSVPLPTNTVNYNFLTGLVEGTPNNSWSVTPPNSTTAKGRLWRTFAPVTAEAFTTVEAIAPNDWKVATVMAQNGSDGSSGVNGTNGKHGAGSYIVTVNSTSDIPNDAGKDSHIKQLSGRDAIQGDILTYRNSGKTFAKSYLRGSSTWSEFQYVFDGSVIVHGTLAAESLKSATSITDVLYVSNAKNTAELTLSGTSDYRIWSGHTSAASAPFSVDRWGNLRANNAKLTNADVAGKVTATSGSFTGTINATSGTFTGTVNANGGTFNNVTIGQNCTVLGNINASQITGVKTLLGSGKIMVGSNTSDRTFSNVDTGIKVPAWGGDAKSSYLVEYRIGGGITGIGNGSATSWTVWETVRPYMLTRWNGPHTLHIGTIRFYVWNGWAVGDTYIEWKAWKIF